MATDRSQSTTPVALAAAGRNQATVLLDTLLNDRRIVEERRAAAGKADPLKTLTGWSSMDRAIVSTREIISRMDDLLEELHETLPKTNGVTPEPPRESGAAQLAASCGAPSHAATTHTPTTQAATRP